MASIRSRGCRWSEASCQNHPTRPPPCKRPPRLIPFRLFRLVFMFPDQFRLLVMWCSESLIKIAEPPLVPLYKPLNYVEVLSSIHEELEQCTASERPGLYLIQSQVFRGLAETKLRQRSLHSAWRCATSVHEKVIFGAWLRYEKRGEEIVADVLASCRKCCRDFGPIDVASEMPVRNFETVGSDMDLSSHVSSMVTFQIGDGRVTCDRCRIASLSIPFRSMLNGPFTESQLELVDLSENGISLEAMRAVSEFSCTHSLGGFLFTNAFTGFTRLSNR